MTLAVKCESLRIKITYFMQLTDRRLNFGEWPIKTFMRLVFSGVSNGERIFYPKGFQVSIS